jgi:hypothetical protein
MKYQVIRSELTGKNINYVNHNLLVAAREIKNSDLEILEYHLGNLNKILEKKKMDINFYATYEEHDDELLSILYALAADATLVKGCAKANKRTHFWVEDGPYVFDASLSVLTSKERYYELFQKKETYVSNEIAAYFFENSMDYYCKKAKKHTPTLEYKIQIELVKAMRDYAKNLNVIMEKKETKKEDQPSNPKIETIMQSEIEHIKEDISQMLEEEKQELEEQREANTVRTKNSLNKIYTFQGTDITSIIKTKIAYVAYYISQMTNKPFIECYHDYIASEAFKELENPLTGLWAAKEEDILKKYYENEIEKHYGKEMK